MAENFLYIGERITKISTGGDAVNERNYSVLKYVWGSKFHHYVINGYSNSLVTFVNLLRGNAGGLCNKDYKQILEHIVVNDIKYVFLWSSKLGKLAKYLKDTNPTLQIITFFHNVEKQYYSEEINLNPTLKNRFIAQIIGNNELLAVQNSDILVTLNGRDSKLLQSYYQRDSDFELPITFEDKYNPEIDERIKLYYKSERIKLLFVGSNFFANTYGVHWFIKNVLPSLPDFDLYIIGKGMDSVFQSTSNIKVRGFVEDLSEWYYLADIVIAPIFHGGGMKTKTAEAIMYGCPIVGTNEAFEGYEVEPERIGGLANNAEEMILKIRHLSDINCRKRCSEYARNIFNQKYSMANTIKILSSFKTSRKL